MVEENNLGKRKALNAFKDEMLSLLSDTSAAPMLAQQVLEIQAKELHASPQVRHVDFGYSIANGTANIDCLLTVKLVLDRPMAVPCDPALGYDEVRWDSTERRFMFSIKGEDSSSCMSVNMNQNTKELAYEHILIVECLPWLSEYMSLIKKMSTRLFKLKKDILTRYKRFHPVILTKGPEQSYLKELSDISYDEMKRLLLDQGITVVESRSLKSKAMETLFGV